MGYKTWFELNANKIEYSPSGDYTLCESIPQTVSVKLEEYIKEQGFFCDYGNCSSGWSIVDKWYDYEDDMIEMSKCFPDILFTLHGVGDDSEDLWFAYFCNGKMQNCPAIITYDDFSPKKLK